MSRELEQLRATFIEAGTAVNALDSQGRTPLMLAVQACVDSYWSARRSPRAVRGLLAAGAVPAGVAFPSGCDEVDELRRAVIG